MSSNSQLEAPVVQVIELDVQGMTCASCAARIQKKLNKLDGVQAAVNYATEKAHIVAPESLGATELIAAIEKAGYGASLPDPAAKAPDRAAELKRRLIICAVLTIPVVAFAMIPPLQFPGWQWLSLLLTTPVVTWGAWGFHRSTWVNLKHGATTMDTLISLGTSAAYLWSLVALIFGSAGEIGMRHHWEFSLTHDHQLSGVYFEAACGIITFILLGRLIEARSRQDASAALQALAEVGAKSVLVRRDGVEIEIPIEGLVAGDEFIVRPGEKIATDGVVVSGHSAVDNSVITGESVPVEVSEGVRVYGAGLNTTGRLVVRATAVGADTQLAQIARLVTEAQTSKSSSQALADKVAGVFVPVVILLAVATLIFWLVTGAGASFAVTAAVSVLIISCPCALGLATPTALLAGSLRGAQLGILIKGSRSLEQAHQIDTIAMDKTGTITEGKMSITEVFSVGVSKDELLNLAAALEAGSTHPIAKAIVAKAGDTATTLELSEQRDHPGRGISASLAGEAVAAGNAELIKELGLTMPAELQAKADELASQGATLVFVARGVKLLGLIAVQDQIAQNSVLAIKEFSRLGLRTVMLTGDHQQAAQLVADELGITEVRAEVMPADKFQVIKQLQAGGAKVAMIGDGVNDAAALSQADLGIAMGAGTDAAIAASDLTLMRHDLRLAADAIRLSRKTLGTIKGNLFWAFFYNVCAIPIAAMGYLNPMFAGAAMAFSSVFVVTNSLRLRHWKAAS